MKRIYIRRISPPALSIVVGMVSALLGVGAVLFKLIGMMAESSYSGHFWERLLSVGLVYFLGPLFLSVLSGVIAGFLIAWIYNFVTRFTKGVLIEYAEAGRYDD